MWCYVGSDLLTAVAYTMCALLNLDRYELRVPPTMLSASPMGCTLPPVWFLGWCLLGAHTVILSSVGVSVFV